LQIHVQTHASDDSENVVSLFAEKVTIASPQGGITARMILQRLYEFYHTPLTHEETQDAIADARELPQLY
jgi:hypothetical protein